MKTFAASFRLAAGWCILAGIVMLINAGLRQLNIYTGAVSGVIATIAVFSVPVGAEAVRAEFKGFGTFVFATLSLLLMCGLFFVIVGLEPTLKKWTADDRGDVAAGVLFLGCGVAMFRAGRELFSNEQPKAQR